MVRFLLTVGAVALVPAFTGRAGHRGSGCAWDGLVVLPVVTRAEEGGGLFDVAFLDAVALDDLLVVGG